MLLGSLFRSLDDLWAPKVAQRLSTWSQKRARGRCENPGTYCTGSIGGGLGEALGGNFFQTASPDPLWRRPGEHFCFHGLILVNFESKLGRAGGRGCSRS